MSRRLLLMKIGLFSGENGLRALAKRQRGVALDPFETSSQLAFLGSFVNIVRMTVVVITFANLWWRST